MKYAYRCDLAADEDGRVVATFPDVPEAITDGKDRAEALEMAVDALDTALEGYIIQGWLIPTPSEDERGLELVQVSAVMSIRLAKYSLDSHESGNDG